MSTSHTTESLGPDRAERNSSFAEEEGGQSCGDDGGWEEAPELEHNGPQRTATNVNAIIFETDPKRDYDQDNPEKMLEPYYMGDSIANENMVRAPL